jgi:alkylation response protein AidB-like acyl-CoA dehydrogenase
MSLLIAEKGPGVTISRDIEKLGYKGVDTVEIAFEDFHVPAANLLGGVEGHGMQHVLNGLEVGRINIASRAVGVARAAFECAIRYSQQRYTFGKPICEHQAIQLKLAGHGYPHRSGPPARAPGRVQEGHRPALRSRSRHGQALCLGDLREVTLEAMRVLGGYGYTKEFPVERFYRDAPLMIIGEGTNEIQRTIIARQLVKRYPA